MRSYYMYKYKEQHDKMNMRLQLQNTEIQNTIHIGTLAISDKTISMRTRKT